MIKKAFIIYGPPGSGKGTQAELLSKKLHLIHFDTGRYIEDLVHSKEAEKDEILRREKKLFDSGILCTPSWVLETVRNASNKIAQSDYGIVFSGSPRTIFEAFGDGANQGLMRALENLYGKKNIIVIKISVPDSESMKRNSRRLICSVCGLPILAKSKIKICAFCGGKTRKRTLDDPSIIKVRLKEYAERTFPIIDGLKKDKYQIIDINGMQEPYNVLGEILKKTNII